MMDDDIKVPVFDWDYEPGWLWVNLTIFGWTVSAHINHEPHFGVLHPDGRFFGFWTEDFEFDRHPADTPDDLIHCEDGAARLRKDIRYDENGNVFGTIFEGHQCSIQQSQSSPKMQT
jgi:hypothetical protein